MDRERHANGLALCTIAAGICIAGASFAAMTNIIKGDPLRGNAVYQACEACHSIDDCPRHRGVVGRRAGSVADYSYSISLKDSGLTWDEATLDRSLTNPSALVPGTKMFFQMSDAQNRADVIAFLKEQQ